MAAALTPTLINKDFQNWLKGALAVLFAKEGLIDLVGHETINFQGHLLQTVYTKNGIPPGTTCNSCTTANVLSCPTTGFCSKGRRCKAHDLSVPEKKPNQVCPNALCSHIRDAIKNEHRFRGASWINTDARRWCSDAFQMSKCFMPPDGYSDKSCLADTDFNGILAVVINNIRFQRKMSVNLGLEPNICTEARTIAREIRHSANHLLSDQDLMKYIDDLITLLSDPAYLAADVKANDAVGKLKQLKTNTITIHAVDITNVLNESIKTTFDDQQKLFLHDIQEHFIKHNIDSIEVIDRKIQESVNKQLTELKTKTDRGKDELTAEIEKGKNELKLQIKTEKEELQVQFEHGKVELQTQLKQGKGDLNSKVEEGKVEICHQTEHGKDELSLKVEKGKGELSAQTEQGNCELSLKIEKGKVELSAQTEQGKGDLNLKVEQGKSELSAQTEQGKDKLCLKVEKVKAELSAKTEQALDELHSQIRQGADELKVQTTGGKEELSSHIAMGKNKIEAKTNQGKEEIEVRGKQVLEEISRSAVLKTGNNDDSLLQGATTKKTQYGFWDKITFKEFRLRSERRASIFLQKTKLTLDLHRLNKLKMLHLEVQCKKLEVNPACVTLSLGHISLSDISITSLIGLTCLQSLYLDTAYMTHSNLKCLYAYISQTTTLTQLKLELIECSDHEGQYRDCDVTLDLHRLNELKMLDLIFVPCRELHVNPACLEKLKFYPPGEKITARASATLWQDLHAAPVLSSLTLYVMTSCQEMIQTIPTLTQLQHLELVDIDMDDVIPRFSPAMSHLEHVKLSYVTMSSAAWRQLLISVGQLQHSVTVELDYCRGPSNEEWKTIVNVIKTTPTLSLLPDLSIYRSGYASLTLKNMKV